MSAENVEIIRSLTDAWYRRDFRTVSAFFDPAVEFRPPPEFPDYEICRGVEEMNSSFRKWTRAWESMRFEAGEYIDAGDRVIATNRQWGKVKGTGIEVQNEVFNVFTLSAGKVVRLEMFYKRGPAFEAAGLSEQGAETDSSSSSS